jgi:hypothetical protein
MTMAIRSWAPLAADILDEIFGHLCTRYLRLHPLSRPPALDHRQAPLALGQHRSCRHLLRVTFSVPAPGSEFHRPSVFLSEISTNTRRIMHVLIYITQTWREEAIR